jgi:hypothetical protein
MKILEMVRLKPDATTIRCAAMAIAALSLAGTAWAQQAGPRADASAKRRYEIKVMEGVLVGAVKHGAEQVGRQLQPQLVLMTGFARARGFVLDGYGVFFDVEIPGMRETPIWTMRILEQDMVAARRTLERLLQQVQMVGDPQTKASLDQGLRQLRAQVDRTSRSQAPASQARMVTGAEIPEGSAAAAAQSAPAPMPAPSVQDPGMLYTESVKSSIVDAMLDHGSPLAIQPDEWLTVAARDGEGPLTPLENYDAVTFIFRIKGSDLAAFRAGSVSREEAQKRVEVRQF